MAGWQALPPNYANLKFFELSNVPKISRLRTFARKCSNIDNFIKLLLLIANKLLVSEMQK